MHRLFVESQVAPLPDPCLDLLGLSDFVEAARIEIGIARARTICCGSSLGATAALLTGAREGLGHVIAGAPIVLLGRYVVDDYIPELVRESVKRSLPVQTRPELDAFVTDIVGAAPGPTRIELFTGDHDHFFPEHPQALEAACKVNRRVRLRTSVAPGVTHDSMYRPWARHLEASLRAILAADDDPDQAAARS